MAAECSEIDLKQMSLNSTPSEVFYNANVHVVHISTVLINNIIGAYKTNTPKTNTSEKSLLKFNAPLVDILDLV